MLHYHKVPGENRLNKNKFTARLDFVPEMVHESRSQWHQALKVSGITGRLRFQHQGSWVHRCDFLPSCFPQKCTGQPGCVIHTNSDQPGIDSALYQESRKRYETGVWSVWTFFARWTRRNYSSHNQLCDDVNRCWELRDQNRYLWTPPFLSLHPVLTAQAHTHSDNPP